jgi:phosphomethylpyrimidine synthase
MCGPKFCSYKITQEIMDNPEGIQRIIDESKAKEAAAAVA